MICSDVHYQPASFSVVKKIRIIFTTIKSPWKIVGDKLGLQKEILYQTVSGSRFYGRPKSTDINEAVVVFSGAEYPPALLNIQNLDKPIVVDCGGNIGTFSLYIKELNPTAKIYIFEPLPENLAILQRNLDLNEIHDAVVIPKALSSDGVEKSFYMEKDKFDGGSMVDQKLGSSSVKISTVKSMTFDDFLLQHVLSRIDLMKMDIEGGEYEIIHANRDSLAKNVKRLIIEYHTNVISDGRDYLVNALTANGEFELIYESKNILGFENIKI
jgi:FkbM family methyltransferase